jgi:quercetin dioxygenase-like cupin family protein
MKAKSIFLFAALFVLGAAVCNAQEKMIFNESDVTWGDAPPVLGTGSKIAVLEGDPSKFGFFTMRIKVQPGFKIQPHWHPSTEHVTIVSGSANFGFGNVFDESKGTKAKQGSFVMMPAKHIHYAWTDEESIIQVHGVGPWQLYFVNPDGTTKSEPTEKH